MAPRRGGYLTDVDWQAAARAELARRGIQIKDLARKMGCASSTMHDILNKPGKATHLLPKINKFLGWDRPGDLPRQPAPPLPSSEALEAAAIFDLLPEELRKAKISELHALLAILPPRDKAND